MFVAEKLEWCGEKKIRELLVSTQIHERDRHRIGTGRSNARQKLSQWVTARSIVFDQNENCDDDGTPML